MIISHSRKFVFIHLQKCGGTSIEYALEPYLSWDDLVLGGTEYGESFQALLYQRYGIDNVQQNMLWKHSNADDIYNFLGKKRWNEYKKIAVVRDPVDMMKSLYYFSQNVIRYHTGRIYEEEWRKWVDDKTFPPDWPYLEKYVQAYIESKVRGKGFDYFVELLLNNDYEFVRPQIDRIRYRILHSNVEKVVDLSDLNNRWEELTSFIGIEDTPPIDKLNSVEKDFEIEMSDKTKKMIKKHFAKDYRYMKYLTNVKWS